MQTQKKNSRFSSKSFKCCKNAWKANFRCSLSLKTFFLAAEILTANAVKSGIDVGFTARSSIAGISRQKIPLLPTPEKQCTSTGCTATLCCCCRPIISLTKLTNGEAEVGNKLKEKYFSVKSSGWVILCCLTLFKTISTRLDKEANQVPISWSNFSIIPL